LRDRTRVSGRAMKIGGMRLAGALAVAAAAVAFTAVAQTTAVDEIAKYRAALQDGNPAELWEARGEGLWKAPRGPKQVSFEQCDIGLLARDCVQSLVAIVRNDNAMAVARQ